MLPGTPQRGLPERLALWRDLQETLGRGITRHDWAERVRPDARAHRRRFYKDRRTCRCAACRQFDRTLAQARRWGHAVTAERSGSGRRWINEYTLGGRER